MVQWWYNGGFNGGTIVVQWWFQCCLSYSFNWQCEHALLTICTLRVPSDFGVFLDSMCDERKGSLELPNGVAIDSSRPSDLEEFITAYRVMPGDTFLMEPRRACGEYSSLHALLSLIVKHLSVIIFIPAATLLHVQVIWC